MELNTINMWYIFLLRILQLEAEVNVTEILKDIEDADILYRRVINGQNASLHEWPWQVSLEIFDQHICGGSLIKPDWVLTAAHCVDRFQAYTSEWNVVVGKHTMLGKTKFQRSFKVQKVFNHSIFSRDHFMNDVALMQLQGSVSLSKQVNVVTLPTQGSRVPVGTVCYITGWGKTNGLSSEPAHVLQEAPLTIASHWHCSIANDYLVSVDDSSMICAGGSEKGGCKGDSGGPLACKEHGRWILRGVVSWGHPLCRTVDHYTVFARVSSLVNWIRKLVDRVHSSGSIHTTVTTVHPQIIHSSGSNHTTVHPQINNKSNLQCYTCISRTTNCQSGIRQCVWPNTVCGKAKLGEGVIKSCTTPTMCRKYCQSVPDCKITCCKENLCNTGILLKPVVVLIIICMVIIW